jgi:Zn-dependent protease
LLFYLDRLGDDFVAGLVFVGAIATALLIGIAFHEFSHAYVADRLGDHLARRMGRVTLNPLAHLDPMGTLLMLLVGFGWGKPVPVNPYATANPKAALWMTAAAGPLSNFLVAAVAGLAIRLDLVPWISPFNEVAFAFLSRAGWTAEEYIGLYLSSVTLFSVILGVFNLFPIAPLDGFKVAVGLLPDDLSRSFAQLERWGPLILIGGLFILPLATAGQISPIFEIMQPLIRLFIGLFAGVDQEVFVG